MNLFDVRIFIDICTYACNCMYMYIYIHTYIHIYIYIHIHIYISTYIHIHLYTHTHIPIYLYIVIYIYMRVYIYIYICICICILYHYIIYHATHNYSVYMSRISVRFHVQSGHVATQLVQRDEARAVSWSGAWLKNHKKIGISPRKMVISLDL